MDKKEMKNKLYHKGCFYCGESFSLDGVNRFSWQHIYPKRKGGKDTIENLRPCCYGCNTDMENIIIDDCPGALFCYRDILKSPKGKIIHFFGEKELILSGKAKKLLRKLNKKVL